MSSFSRSVLPSRWTASTPDLLIYELLFSSTLFDLPNLAYSCLLFDSSDSLEAALQQHIHIAIRMRRAIKTTKRIYHTNKPKSSVSVIKVQIVYGMPESFSSATSFSGVKEPAFSLAGSTFSSNYISLGSSYSYVVSSSSTPSSLVVSLSFTCPSSTNSSSSSETGGGGVCSSTYTYAGSEQSYTAIIASIELG